MPQSGTSLFFTGIIPGKAQINDSIRVEIDITKLVKAHLILYRGSSKQIWNQMKGNPKGIQILLYADRDRGWGGL